MSEKRDFVLVHGAWCSAWFWDRVSRLLEADGHRVFAPTLTGLGERAHVMTDSATMDTHIEDVRRLITFRNLTDIVLVGHSYGGLVISGVAQALPSGTIGSIVYLDALMAPFPPDDAESPPLPVSVEDGMVAPPPPEMFGLDGEEATEIMAHCTPMAASALFQPIGPCPAVETIGIKTYILAERSMSEFRTIHAKKARDASWRTATIDARHDTMIDDPEGTARLLLDAAS